jgi:serine/threonine-protein kinase RsbW
MRKPVGSAESMRIQVMMTLPREAASVPLARHTVATALSGAGIEQDCVREIEVALSEACTNAYRHTGEGGDYEVVVDIADRQLTLDVLDPWTGFGHPTGWPSATMPDDSAQNPCGLALMTALTDQATFDPVAGDGGPVHLVKRLRWAADAPLTPGTRAGHAHVREARAGLR